MCWVGKLSDKQKLSRKLKCYKIVESDLTSIYKGFQYEIGKTYSIPHLEPKEIDSIKIYLGVGDLEIGIDKGFHFYTFDKSSAASYLSTVLLICEIPEDAECYINWYGTGVTNKITIKEVIPNILQSKRYESNNS